MNGVIKLGKYIGLGLEKPVIQVTKEQIEETCRSRQRKFASNAKVERAAQDTDIVNIDFEGFLNGEKFEGGSSQGFDLELGSNSFIDGFEEQLIGAEAGDEREVNVTFPADYVAADLAGKPVVFKVKVNGVFEQTFPELDKSVLEEIIDSLEMFAAQESEQAYEDLIVQTLIDNSELDIPAEVLAVETEELFQQWSAQIRMNGIDIEQFYAMTGTNEAAVKEELQEQAIYRSSSRLLLEAVAEAEGMKATKAAITIFLSQMATQYGVPLEDLEKTLPAEHMDAIESDVRIRKALQFIKDHMND